MGGGDLNFKKSWHPSTMKNMEKVWKAEQKHDQEKKRIAELQKEICEERQREDLQKFAEEKGVIEKKDDVKLDWMYKGPGGHVDREEYLLGRAIDKSFELLDKSEKGTSTVTVPKSTVEKCLPNSVFVGGDKQVDMARKLQEDPLYAIKKKELESRSQILKNPVKLKQLQELLKRERIKKVKKHKKEKKKKKHKKRAKSRSSSDNSSSEEDLDALLLSKYKRLKDKLNPADIAKLKRTSDNSDSETEKKSKHNRFENHISQKRRHDDDSSDDEHNRRRVRRSYGLMKPPGTNPEPHKKNIQKEVQPRYVPSAHESSGSKWVRPEKKKLSEAELERKRQEMIANARWRDQERVKNVARYKEEEKIEKQQRKDFTDDFLRNQLSKAAFQTSVENRIKSNMNNIQRSGMAMDRHFARR